MLEVEREGALEIEKRCGLKIGSGVIEGDLRVDAVVKGKMGYSKSLLKRY